LDCDTSTWFKLSFLVFYSDCQWVELFAAPNAAELAFQMFYRIHQIAFFTFLGLFIKSFRDHVSHTGIDKYMDLLKSISKCGAEESKLRSPGFPG
jgi:hypothetical protein